MTIHLFVVRMGSWISNKILNYSLNYHILLSGSLDFFHNVGSYSRDHHDAYFSTRNPEKGINNSIFFAPPILNLVIKSR